MKTTKFKQTKIGEMPEDWEVNILASCAEFKYGLGESAEEKGDYRYIRITDITSDGFLDKTKVAFVKKEKVKNDCILSKRDVLVARTGASFGKTYIFRENFKATYGGFLIKFMFNDKIDNEFFFQFSRSKMYWDQANNLVNGGAQPQFNANTIAKLIVPCPTIDEQRAIARVLSDLDDKVELNREMNATLEELAQALFKRWFVDFEFPNENGEPYKSSGGKMKQTEQGEIPESWSIGCLTDITKITSGKRPDNVSNTRDVQHNVPLIGASKIMGFVSRSLFEQPVIVIGRVGTHGRVQRFSEPSFPSDNTLVFQSDFYEYIYQILTQIDYSKLNIGAVQPLITQTMIGKYVTLIPDNDVLTLFEKTVSTYFAKMLENRYEIENLQSIRDLLLPKLMSGKIRVSVDAKL